MDGEMLNVHKAGRARNRNGTCGALFWSAPAESRMCGTAALSSRLSLANGSRVCGCKAALRAASQSAVKPAHSTTERIDNMLSFDSR